MHGFKVKVERRWQKQTVAIWFYRPAEAGPFVVARQTGKPDEWQDVKVQQGEQWVTPSLELPVDLYEQLVAAGSDFFPPSAATDRHLNDTIKVRDRLLDLIAPE